MIRYVAGFLFDHAREHVVLIEKQTPARMKGCFNAVGGKIESGETDVEAMVREFSEETDLEVRDWHRFCTLRGDSFEVVFFRAFAPLSFVLGARTTTAERVCVSRMKDVPHMKRMGNLDWLIAMALSLNSGAALSFDVTETLAA